MGQRHAPSPDFAPTSLHQHFESPLERDRRLKERQQWPASLADLTSEQRSAARKRLATLAPADVTALTPLVHEEIRQRCQTDGPFFLQFVRTRDEADPEHAQKPLPPYPYLVAVWDAIQTSPVTVIAKSRQMMMSWLLCAYCVWWARSKPHQAVYWQAQKWDDACEKIAVAGGGEGRYMGRCQLIEHALPAHLRYQVRCTEGRIEYPNGSIVQALAGGADQIRGKVGSVIVLDEFAFQEDARGVYTAVAPLVQKGTKLVIVSTPNGRENIFADLWHGHTTVRT